MRKRYRPRRRNQYGFGIGDGTDRETRLRAELLRGKGDRTWEKIAALTGYSRATAAYTAAKRLGLLTKPIAMDGKDP